MKISMLVFCTAATIGSCAGLARAQDSEFNCANPQAQQEMNYCSNQDYLKADKQLNAAYRKAMASQVAMDKAETNPQYVGAVRELKKAQRAWIDYRDGHCHGVGYEAAGGSLESLLVSSCMTTLTRNRIKELNELTQGLGN
jgi:uncharacterized protein YecT (DUF1311 family)